MIKINKNIPLASLTTLGIGGNASLYALISNKKELVEAVEYAQSNKISFRVLGGGSNVLVSSKSLSGLIIKLTNKGVCFKDAGKNTVEVTAGAGKNWDELVAECVAKNLWGIECLSWIPGTVGAAPVQNIGAYGQEIKDVFLNLCAYDCRENTYVNLSKSDCQFGYRESIFKNPAKKNRYVVFEISLLLTKNGKSKVEYSSLKEYLESKGLKKPSLQEVREAVIAVRKMKLEDPSINPNAGSFFKNPIISKRDYQRLAQKNKDIPAFETDDGKYKLFAAWFIDKAGWKGKGVGGASVSTKNALVIVNKDRKAISGDVLELARLIKKDIEDKFGISLEQEVQYLE